MYRLQMFADQPAAATAGGGGGNIIGWWDASDSDSITKDGSNLVSQWDDKSGNGNHAVQAVGAKQPLLLPAEQNGLDVLSFGNGAYGMSTGLALDSAPYTMFVVFNRNSTYAGGTRMVQGSINWTVSSYGGKATYYSWPGFVSNRVVMTVGQYYMIGATNTGSASAMYLDGTDETDASSNVSAPGYVYFGVDTGSYTTERARGELCEVIIYNEVLSTSDRQEIEGYLAHKWGLEDSLPSDHPYKSAPPA